MQVRGRLISLCFAAALACAASAESAWRVIESPVDDFIGWVKLPDGSAACLTWRASGGLWLHDIPNGRIDVVEARDDGSLWWEAESLSLTPVRDDRGRVAAWKTLDASGQTQTIETINASPYAQRQVSITSADGVEIVATLLLPNAKGKSPGAVVLQGSGESSRDNQWALTFADALARAGIAAVHMDKRGSGMSGGDWETASFDLLAADAIAAMAALRAQPEVDPSRTGFVGLSQGGWIAPLAAMRLQEQRELAAFTVSVSGTVVTAREQVRHEVEQDFRNAGLPDEAVTRLLGVVDLSMEYMATGEGWEAYLAALEALRDDDLLAPVAAGFPDDPESSFVRFWKRNSAFDPAPLWQALDAPSLLLYGEEDERDNIPVRATVARLERIAPRAAGSMSWTVYAGMGHGLFDPETGWVSAEALDRLCSWILDAAE